LSLKSLALDPLPLAKRTGAVFARLYTAIYIYQETSEFGILDQLVDFQCVLIPALVAGLDMTDRSPTKVVSFLITTPVPVSFFFCSYPSIAMGENATSDYTAENQLQTLLRTWICITEVFVTDGYFVGLLKAFSNIVSGQID